MISKTQGPKLKVIDTPGVAEVHADNIVSVIATQAGVVVTLGATRGLPAFIEESPEPFIAMNARIALTPPAVAALHQRLGIILAAFTPPPTQDRRREQMVPIRVPTGAAVHPRSPPSASNTGGPPLSEIIGEATIQYGKQKVRPLAQPPTTKKPRRDGRG